LKTGCPIIYHHREISRENGGLATGTFGTEIKGRPSGASCYVDLTSDLRDSSAKTFKYDTGAPFGLRHRDWGRSHDSFSFHERVPRKDQHYVCHADANWLCFLRQVNMEDIVRNET